MHHARRVGDDEHLRDLLRDGHAPGRAEAVPDRVVQRFALDELQHQPVVARSFDVVIDAADVGMIELRQDLGFAQEPGLRLRVQTVVGPDRFERDAALERLVDAGIHLPHPSTAEAMEHAVVGDAERRCPGADEGSIAETRARPAAVECRAIGYSGRTPRPEGVFMHRRFVACAALLVAAGLGAAAQDRPLNQPPAGFTSLFGGKDLAGWVGRQGTYSPYQQAKLTPDALAAKQAEWNAYRDKHWRVDVAKGEIVSDGQGVHLATGKAFADFELYVDWLMVSPGGDSGIYLRSFPQVQIRDLADPREAANGAAKGSGALWNNNNDNPGKWPLVKADNPIGQWNTLRVRMVGGTKSRSGSTASRPSTSRCSTTTSIGRSRSCRRARSNCRRTDRKSDSATSSSGRSRERSGPGRLGARRGPGRWGRAG